MNLFYNPCIVLCAVLGFVVITVELSAEQLVFTMYAVPVLLGTGGLFEYLDHRQEQRFIAKDPEKSIWWEKCGDGYRPVANTYKLAAAIEKFMSEHHPDYEVRDGKLVRNVDQTSMG